MRYKQKEDMLDIRWRIAKRADVDFIDRIIQLTHLRGTTINYQSDKDCEIMKLLFRLWEEKRPGQLGEYLEKARSIREVALNRHIATRDKGIRFLALMPTYLDMLIRAVWRNQKYDGKFYNWFLDKFGCFQLPEKR
ncbi:MAG: hypothetical protein ACOY0S_04330 [Patescibacteria group bacterium]